LDAYLIHLKERYKHSWSYYMKTNSLKTSQPRMLKIILVAQIQIKKINRLNRSINIWYNQVIKRSMKLLKIIPKLKYYISNISLLILQKWENTCCLL
jgi:hypothetical protein